MATVQSNVNHVSDAINAWKLSSGPSESLSFRAEALIDHVNKAANQALTNLAFTINTHVLAVPPSEPLHLTVIDFTDYVNGLREWPTPEPHLASVLFGNARVLLVEGMYFLRPGGERGIPMGLESEIVMVIPGEASQQLYGLVPDRVQSLTNLMENTDSVESFVEGITIVCLDKGAVMSEYSLYNRLTPKMQFKLPIETLTQTRTLETLMGLSRIYHHPIHGTIVCIEPNTMSDSERRTFLDLDKNLHSPLDLIRNLDNNTRRVALITDRTMRELEFIQGVESFNCQRSGWKVSKDDHLKMLPNRCPQTDLINVEIDGQQTNFVGLLPGSQEWNDLRSKIEIISQSDRQVD